MAWVLAMLAWWKFSARAVFGVMALALALSAQAQAQAADPALRADVQPLALRSRTNAPSFIDVRLQSNQRTILEGVLELRIMAGNYALYRVRTPELVVVPGTATQRVLLPPASSRITAYRSALDVHVLFVAKSGTLDLGRFPIASEGSAAREYVIGVCTTGPAGPPDRPKLWQALRPEPPSEDSATSRRLLGSTPVLFSPEDLPSAIGLCAFDIVALEGASFAALTEKQLGALTTWVEAGGSLCVVPTALLGAEHVAFLNALASEPGQPAAVTMMPDGSLTIEGAPVLFRRPGIGRLVIARAAPSGETDPTAPAWSRVASFLAKTRTSPVQAGTFQSWQRAYTGEGQDRASAVQSTLFQHLPRESRVIPLSVVAAILGAFVLAVGPGEWLILGRLRARRWTWVTFPLLATGFTLVGIRTAEFYLGRNDKLATLIVTDVGRDGRVVRENRFELRLAGRDKIADLDMHQTLGAVCAPSGTSHSTSITPLYEGQIPGRYTMRLPLRQWDPVLVRTMTLGPGSAPLDINWPQMTKGSPDRLNDEDRRDGPWTLNVLERRTAIGRRRYSQWHEKLVGRITSLELDDEPTSATYSPSGQPDLLDLAIADESDSSEWMVFASKTIPGGLHIVRRLYYLP